MKLSELIQEYEDDMRAKAEKSLQSLDWNFDVDPFQGRRFARGQQAMNEAQAALKQLYAKSPDVAAQLWEKHCPYAQPGIFPSWILA